MTDRQRQPQYAPDLASILALDDDADRELVDNVHPADWVNPDPASRYNLVVIGAGAEVGLHAHGTEWQSQ